MSFVRPIFRALLVPLFSLPVQAQSTWTGGGGNAAVSTAGNWSPSGAPVSGSALTLAFPTASPSTVNFDSAYTLSAMAFTGTSAYVINGGTLSLGSGGITSTQTAGGAVINNTVLLTADATLATGVFNLSIGGAGAIANGGHALTLSSTGGALTVGGNITGTGSLTVAGSSPGVIFLTGTGNTYSGGTTINTGGTLNVGSVSGVIGSLPGDVTNNGTLNFKPSTTSYSYGGVISGSGRLQMLGTNILTLLAQNLYAGQTTVASGTLVIGAVNALPTTTQLSIGATGIVEVANDQTIEGFAGNNAAAVIKIESGKALTVTVDPTLGSSAYGGTIADGASPGGRLVIGSSGGARTVTLTGTNTYTGGTTIVSGGVLRLGNNTATGSILGNITNDGQIIFHRSNSATFAGVISGSGSVSQDVTSGAPTGTTTLTAANTYAGGTTVYGGKLLIGNATGSATGTGPVTVNPGPSATSATFGGVGTSTGSLTLNSDATVQPHGTLNVGPTTFASDTNYEWPLFDATAAAGTGYGLLNVNGALTLNATAANPLVIKPTTVDHSGNAAPAANFDPTQNYSFTLASSSGITGFDAMAIAFDFSGFQNTYTGSWSAATSLDGEDLLLNYTAVSAVPEPAVSALLAGLAACGLVLWRRTRV